MPVEDRYANLPFTEAQEYLRGKINLDTDRWDDILNAEHDAAFVVAGAKGSLLSDLRGAVDRAIANGQRPEDFQKDFERIAEDWAHTGDKAWRSNIIYQTNLTQSYAAGRYTYQLDPDVVKVQPYLQWVHGDSARPRPSHLALDRRVFRADSLPFYPPNGYGCLCRTISLTQRQLERQELEVSDLKQGDQISVEVDGRVYNPVLQPDKGFDRIPGQGDRRKLLEGMIARFPASVAKPLRDELDRIDAAMAAKKKPKTKASDGEEFPEVNTKKLKSIKSRFELTAAGDKAEVVFEPMDLSVDFSNAKKGDSYTVLFKVNGGYDAGTISDSREGVKAALKIRKQIQNEIAKIPDGTLLSNSPHDGDGKGNQRAALYKSFGFSDVDNSGLMPQQWAIVQNGKLRPITVSQVEELLKRKK